MNFRKLKAQAKKKEVRMSGFSLIEIMIVVALIGLLMVGAVVYFIGQLRDGETTAARSQAYEIGKALDLYRLKFRRYPGVEEGLDLLVTPPRGEPFLERMPKDPWGQEYIYVFPGTRNKRKPDVISRGPDGIEDTEDDIGNWTED